ncbi:MAG TPA: SulP family inorganic anion transporter [Acidobacteriota bacterium]|nr:SulP family inorganic anion transporter [Acidobacteriota bacterium]
MKHGGGLRAAGVFPGLTAFAGYRKEWIGHDLLAGVSVAAVAIPIAIAYAQLAGLPPVCGLYTSILPLVLYVAFGTSRQLIIAPDAATCAIVAAVCVPLAAGDMDRAVSLSMALSLMTGLFCIAGGLLRLGFLTNFLSRPILMGYINGIGLSIIAGQLGKLCGFELRSTGFFRTLWQFFSKMDQIHWLTLVLSLGFLAGLRLLKIFLPRVPGPLAAVAAGIWISEYFNLGARGVTLLGNIPAGLPGFMVPDISFADLAPLAAGAIGLSLISFNSAMVTARGFAVRNRYEIDPNREFIALGVCDIGAGLMQGFAVSGADSRTAVNDSAGGKSQLTSLVAACLILLTLIYLTVPLASLPIAVLAAVLVNSVFGLFDMKSLMVLRKASLPEFRISMVTLAGVISVGVLPGVLVAVIMALLLILAKASRPNDAVLGRVGSTGSYADISGNPEAETIPGFILFRFDAQLLFFNADRFKSRVRALVSKAGPQLKFFVLHAGTMTGIDITGAAVLGEIAEELREKGITLALASPKEPLRFMLEKTGLYQRVGRDNVFLNLDASIAGLQSRPAAAL